MSALLELHSVSVTLRNVAALDGVSLCVSPGEIVALLGPNGAGKTTLMRAATGAVRHEGRVALSGADPRMLSARQRALRVAYLPQRPQSIWPVSVESLVALGRYAHGAAPDRLSPRDQAAVDAAIEACSLTALRTRRMDEVSGGEKARAHLARALAQQAPLLMLDEPTAGLDPAQALGVAEILRKHAANGGGVLLSTHDIALAASAADRVLLLRQGRAIAEGAPIEALTPAALESAYGRTGALMRVGESYVAAFH
ncbi:MAG TPA: ABC transporter ATP-binding protein [Vitreimonas sp.]|uniref:ABC transporter ATP-binding protein n=1 Tax=Vitreimonas sp. TaxID=3069702 RepID=UPI002D40FC40|nr:ABC transporter ATP-binding protein [Vitreimonas sp.]HYD88653.1 ABC transporter ATP-binding protein [Vitreimonas sp.]